MDGLLVEERQAEIDDPGFTGPIRARVVRDRSRVGNGGVEHDVGRLDVAMNGSHGVGVGQRVGDLRDQLDRGLDGPSRRVPSKSRSDVPVTKSQTRMGRPLRSVTS